MDGNGITALAASSPTPQSPVDMPASGFEPSEPASYRRRNSVCPYPVEDFELSRESILPYPRDLGDLSPRLYGEDYHALEDRRQRPRDSRRDLSWRARSEIEDGSDERADTDLRSRKEGLRRQRTRSPVNRWRSRPPLSIDYPMPSAIKNAVQSKYREEYGEFQNLRYTAVTVDPNDFTLKNGYDLRPRLLNRHTEHLVCVTYYNEDKSLLSRTMHSLFENIRDIYNLKKSTFWNKGGSPWQKMVVCIVMDGIDHCDESVLDVMAVMGVFQRRALRREIDGEAVTAHLFECTTQLSVTSDQRLVRPTDDGPHTLPPVQLMLCLKTRNAGKINSSRWIYHAFGRILNPEIVSNIDTGTYLGRNALLRLWESFYNSKDLGGACGALHVDLVNGEDWDHPGNTLKTLAANLLNPIVAAQNFEYEVAIQLERTLEASTGYLSVLPGAFSGYRYRAVMGCPLDAYFQGDPTLKIRHGSKAADDIYTLNRFLADDRILALEVVIKPQAKWHTNLVSTAMAYTDVPSNTTDFINQRRRWLNGAFAATVYSFQMLKRLPQSKHNKVRQAMLLIQLLHNTLSFVLAWFSLSGFLLTIFIVNDVSGSPPEDAPVEGFPFGSATPIVNAVIQVVYTVTIVYQFVMALGSRPKSQVASYTVSFAIFALVQAYMLMNLIYLTKRLVDFKRDANGGSNYAFINEYYSDVGWLTIFITAISVFGVYIAAGILALSPWHLFTSWAQYMFISSSYTNILNIYAFSNIHDVSWGHKSGKKALKRTSTFMEPTNEILGDRGGLTGDQIDPAMDIDADFEQTVKRALTPHERVKVFEPDDMTTKFMKFRTILVAAYIFSNFLVCIIVLDQTFQGFYLLGDPYWHKVWFFRIWMWSNSSLFMLKCVGMIWYRILDPVRRALNRR